MPREMPKYAVLLLPGKKLPVVDAPVEIKILETDEKNINKLLKAEIMKSLVKKKVEVQKVNTKKVAQCCAKTSKTVVGCHD